MPSNTKQINGEDGLACVRCRERKIRCGRERPTCSNCEREPDACCQYKHPTKRVNHLKLLCDSMDLVQSRLSIMETHIMASPPDGPKRTSRDRPSPPKRHRTSSVSDDGVSQYGEPDTPSDASTVVSCTHTSELHVCQNPTDQIARWRGFSSLFVLCNHLKLRVANQSCTMHDSQLWLQTLQSVCEEVSASEPFPAFSDQPFGKLIPKPQAHAAVKSFFCHLDYTTDIFNKDALLGHIDRIYSARSNHDEVWVVCLRTIVLLVLSRQIPTSMRTGDESLFGNFARAFLPSRAELVSSKLLTTPCLANVQTLILLSVAAQQLDDPLEWSELLFTYACTLARTMGLHRHAIDLNENIWDANEKAKVFRSLFCRDRSLFTSFGCMPSLPTHDTDAISHLTAAIDQTVMYSDRIRLALIQDEIYHITHTPSDTAANKKQKAQAAVTHLEQQLESFAETLISLDHLETCPSQKNLLALEFLGTRILAFHHFSQKRHTEQIMTDSRAACALFLISNGSDQHHLLGLLSTVFQSQSKKSDIPLTDLEPKIDINDGLTSALLDAFPASAFFALLRPHVGLSADEVCNTTQQSDIELLRAMSKCYAGATIQMQASSYPRKAAQVFDTLLTTMEFCATESIETPNAKQQVPPVANMVTKGAAQTPIDLSTDMLADYGGAWLSPKHDSAIDLQLNELMRSVVESSQVDSEILTTFDFGISQSETGPYFMDIESFGLADMLTSSGN